MTATRISTLYQNQTALNNLQAANSAMQLSTYQITTGNKYQTLGDEGSTADQILSLQDLQQRTTTYQSNITSATNTLTATEQALNNLTDLITSATSLATEGSNENTADTRASLASSAQALAQQFYTIFNTQYNGTYIFSGQNGDTPPVAGAATATAYPGDPLPTTYYQGDSQVSKIVTGPGTTQDYGVTGDNSAFAQLKAGLESLWYGLQNNSPTDLDQASVALNNAKTGVSSLLGQVGGQQQGLQQTADRYTTQATALTSQMSDLSKVDISSALTQYSQQQAVLQASMLIISQSSQVSLLNYLK